jgi:hypothetical protein
VTKLTESSVILSQGDLSKYRPRRILAFGGLNSAFKDSRSASAHYIEQMLRQIGDPCITVETSQPKLIDHIYLAQKATTNSDMQKSVTVVKIKDPVSNLPLCQISNP